MPRPLCIILAIGGPFPLLAHFVQGPVSLTIFFARNSNSMETSPFFNSIVCHQVPTIFLQMPWPHICCAMYIFFSDHCIRHKSETIHRIKIAMVKPLVKRGPGPNMWNRRYPSHVWAYLPPLVRGGQLLCKVKQRQWMHCVGTSSGQSSSWHLGTIPTYITLRYLCCTQPIYMPTSTLLHIVLFLYVSWDSTS